MERFDLNGTWQMYESGGSQKLSAAVPGSVLSVLLAHQEIPDPYDRTNEYEVRERLRGNYTFERTFELSENWCDRPFGGRTELVCDGLDTIADVYLNGEFLGRADNMHRTWRFDCGGCLKTTNVLTIKFISPITWIESHPASPGKEISYAACGCMPGSQYIRKAHSMFGWDWGPQLPDMGIWRSIGLECRHTAVFSDVNVSQYHEDNKVRLSVEAKVELLGADDALCVGTPIADVLLGSGVFGGAAVEVLIFVKSPDGEIIAEKQINLSNSGKVSAEFDISKPQRWWPNGLGAHPLYTVDVMLCDVNGRTLEEKQLRIGLRTLTVSREKDKWGSEFAFVINGVKIFAMGADYIPEDCIYSRIDRQKIKYLIDTAADSNFNCLRVWGGGYYPSDDFYDLCDEAGLIVWQDLMYACNIYDIDEAFEENIIAETMDNVRRIRHHACLGLICGNNEMEMGWEDWADVSCHSGILRADYIKQFEYILPKAVKNTGVQTFYWPSSPSNGGGFVSPNDENHGDTHYWDVWHGQKPFSDYRKYYFRFCSEFGFQSFPLLKTVKTFTEPKDRNIFSKVMESHQKNGAANGKILYYISENFLYPKDFESLLYISQVVQGMAIKYGVEHWRRNRGRCMGALYWQLNDNWPVASWSSVDYFGRWKVLQYMARKFFGGLLGTIYEEDESIHISAVNDTMEISPVRLILRLKNMDFDILDEYEISGSIPALAAKKFGLRSYENFFKGTNAVEKEDVFAEAVFRFGDSTSLIQTETFVPYKHLHIKRPNIRAVVTEMDDCYKIELSSDVYTPFVWLDLKENDVRFSDNCFNISGREPVVIKAGKTDMVTGGLIEIKNFKEQFFVRSLYDTISI